MKALPFLVVSWVLLSSPGAAASDFDAWNDTARYAIDYRVDISALSARKADRVNLWIPGPVDTRSQRVISSEIESPWGYRMTRDSHGNRFVYLERADERAGSEVVMRYVIEREPLGIVPADVALKDRPMGPEAYRSAQKRIPLQGTIEEIAVEQVEGLESNSEKIRAFYDYVVDVMTYDKTGEGWGNGDAIWACTSKYGNCTDFHSLFMGMARSQGIPARFVIGYPISPESGEGPVKGYHCWTEVFDEAVGWVPLDASEAKKSGRVDDYFGRLPSDRVEFTVGRDLMLEPAQEGAPLNYAIYPYAEVDGEPIEDVPWTMSYRRVASVPKSQKRRE